MLKTAELQGAELDGYAAMASRVPGRIETYGDKENYIERYFIRTDEMKRFSPSTKWADGGSIIEHGRVALRPRLNVSHSEDAWEAGVMPNRIDSADPDSVFTCTGPTALIAAMRAYVTFKIGKEVEDIVNT